MELVSSPTSLSFEKDYFIAFTSKPKGGSTEVYFQSLTAAYLYSIERNHFQLNFSFTGNFTCQQMSCKQQARTQMQAQYLLLDKLMRFNSQPHNYFAFFELAYAQRVIVGLFENFNQMNSTLFKKEVWFKPLGIAVHINCFRDPDEGFERELDPNNVTISFSQNTIEWLLPWDLDIQLSNKTYMEILTAALHYDESKQIIDWLSLAGFSSADKQERIGLTRDPQVFKEYYRQMKDKPDAEKIQEAGIFTEHRNTFDHDNDEMDRTMLRSNLFFTFQGKGTSLTVVPIEVELDVIHKIRWAASSRFGHTQEVKSQRMGFVFSI